MSIVLVLLILFLVQIRMHQRASRRWHAPRAPALVRYSVEYTSTIMTSDGHPMLPGRSSAMAAVGSVQAVTCAGGSQGKAHDNVLPQLARLHLGSGRPPRRWRQVATAPNRCRRGTARRTTCTSWPSGTGGPSVRQSHP